jgi:predicted transcriptional regulator
LAEQLCGGSLTPLLTHLVRAESLSPAERQSLRDLINELDGERKRPRKGR